eukprot:TRINITY_DN21882_c0_g1_i1.p1 TRINITY_DN21882_c0_g1~~TRINITY_DN21882_c0_g1_i1.p1  ORF type:complete len:460 (+),score=63.63 TRINITY_DN21882_c0_g1_i1:79-1458(+)
MCSLLFFLRFLVLSSLIDVSTAGIDGSLTDESVGSSFPEVDMISAAELETENPNEVSRDYVNIGDPQTAVERDQKRQQRIAFCTFDAALATLYLMRAGVELTAGLVACDEYANATAACTQDISGVVASFAEAGSFFAGVADECPVFGSSAERECAEALQRLIGSIAELVAGAAGSHVQCDYDLLNETAKMIEEGQYASRRLMSSSTTVQAVFNISSGPLLQAECACDTSSAALLLGYAGLEITGATSGCTQAGHERACASEVSGALSSLAFVATYLSAAASECATTANVKAACSSDISKMVAAIADIASTASGIADVCIPSALNATDWNSAHRRLGRAAVEEMIANASARPTRVFGDRRLDAARSSPVTFGMASEARAALRGSANANAATADMASPARPDASGSQIIAEERAILLNVVSAGGVWGADNVARVNELTKRYRLRSPWEVKLPRRANRDSFI